MIVEVGPNSSHCILHILVRRLTLSRELIELPVRIVDAGYVPRRPFAVEPPYLVRNDLAL